MTRTRSRRWSALVAVLSVIALAACGGSESEPDTSGETTDQGDSGTAADDATGGDGETVDEAREFFANNNVDFVVPFEPGGGFDFYVRQIAPLLGEELGTTVVVRNEPGAGGLAATNATYAAEGDGLRLILLDTAGVITAQLGGAEGVRYEAADFTWLARITGEPDVLGAAADGGWQTFDELVEGATEDEPARVAVLGPGDISVLEALLLEELFDIPVEIIPGFDGAPAAQAAVIRGESDVYSQSLSGSLSLIEGGEVTGLGLFANEPSPLLPDVPDLLSELTDRGASEDDIQAMRTHNSVLATGRSIVAAPGVSDARTQVLREALAAVATNDEFLAALEEQGRPLDFLTGEEIDTIAQEASSDVPQPYLDIVARSTEVQ